MLICKRKEMLLFFLFSSVLSFFFSYASFLSDAFSVNSSWLPFLSCVQGVVAAEKSRGGQLLEEPKMLPFLANTFSLQVSIQDVPQFLWSIKPFTTCQVTMAAADKMSPYRKTEVTYSIICKILKLNYCTTSPRSTWSCPLGRLDERCWDGS